MRSKRRNLLTTPGFKTKLNLLFIRGMVRHRSLKPSRSKVQNAVLGEFTVTSTKCSSKPTGVSPRQRIYCCCRCITHQHGVLLSNENSSGIWTEYFKYLLNTVTSNSSHMLERCICGRKKITKAELSPAVTLKVEKAAGCDECLKPWTDKKFAGKLRCVKRPGWLFRGAPKG